MQNTESQSHGLKADAVGFSTFSSYLIFQANLTLFNGFQSKIELTSTLHFYLNIKVIQMLQLSLQKSNTRASLLALEVKSRIFHLFLNLLKSNAKSALTKNENYYVRNRQVNQLYQLFLDKRPLRKALENDMQRLYNQVRKIDLRHFYKSGLD